ncbi:MAG: hypothetical protein ACO3ZG_06985 [Kiritimatiellia bacterium]
MKTTALFILTISMAWATMVRASDAGDPVFPLDLGYQARAEIIYQARDRELDRGRAFEADLYTLRLHSDVGEFATLDFDLGGIQADGGDLEFRGGLGLRHLAYDREQVRVAARAQIHYTPGLRLGTIDYDDLIEVEAGVNIAAKIRLDDQVTLMPYAGPAVSILRLSGDVDRDEDQMVGAVVGISFLLPGNNTFRFESQIFDAVGFAISAGIAF